MTDECGGDKAALTGPGPGGATNLPSGAEDAAQTCGDAEWPVPAEGLRRFEEAGEAYGEEVKGVFARAAQACRAGMEALTKENARLQKENRNLRILHDPEVREFIREVFEGPAKTITTDTTVEIAKQTRRSTTESLRRTKRWSLALTGASLLVSLAATVVVAGYQMSDSAESMTQIRDDLVGTEDNTRRIAEVLGQLEQRQLARIALEIGQAKEAIEAFSRTQEQGAAALTDRLGGIEVAVAAASLGAQLDRIQTAVSEALVQHRVAVVDALLPEPASQVGSHSGAARRDSLAAFVRGRAERYYHGLRVSQELLAVYVELLYKECFWATYPRDDFVVPLKLACPDLQWYPKAEDVDRWRQGMSGPLVANQEGS
ncbi:MAG: hypothetical protein AB1505_28835 [Candidatus Latescibacterota bacterium]